jgi:hypothetical protein
MNKENKYVGDTYFEGVNEVKSPRTSQKKKGYKIFYLPKNKRGFQYVPKTKRLRKKKGWLLCSGCNHWFRKFDGTWATRKDGKYICNKCLIKLIG